MEAKINFIDLNSIMSNPRSAKERSLAICVERNSMVMSAGETAKLTIVKLILFDIGGCLSLAARWGRSATEAIDREACQTCKASINVNKLIYLDFNVMADLYQRRRPGLPEWVDSRKAKGDIFPYSPAHMEEVAVVFRSQLEPLAARQVVADQIDLVAGLSDCWVILPGLGNAGPSRVLQEHPSICMKRVLDNYDGTLSAEENERFQMSWKTERAFNRVQEEFEVPTRAGTGLELFPEKRERLGIDCGITNLAPEQVFQHPGILKALEEKLWNYNWTPKTMPRGDELMISHCTRQNVVNLMFRLLDQVNYSADGFGKYRSHLHDVSHAIYAAEAATLVTGDRRYARRVSAVYHQLGIDTRIVQTEELGMGT